MKNTISHNHWASIGKIGANARRKVDPAPTYVRIRSHHIFILLLSAITPRDGLIIAINRVPIATANDHTASPCISIEPIVVVNPLAFKKR